MDLPPVDARATIVAFGDSITEWSFIGAAGCNAPGWGQRLCNYYGARADVLNRGYSGYNTKFARLALRKLLHEENPKRSLLTNSALWIVMFGANDSALPDGSDACVHIPIEEYEENLISIIETLQKHAPKSSILVLTPSPVDDSVMRSKQADHFNPEHTNETTGLYADAAMRAAGACKVAMADVYTGLSDACNHAELLSDGLHLNDKGNEALFNVVRTAIERDLPHLARDNLPRELPEYQALIGPPFGRLSPDEEAESIFNRM